MILRNLKAGRADRVCLTDHEREVTYGELESEVRRYAGLLAGEGVRPGCRALVVSDDSVSAVVAILGLWWMGCIPVPVNPILRDPEILFLADDSGAEFAQLNVDDERKKLLMASLGSVTCVEEHGPSAEPGEPMSFKATDEALVQYTSGSTGKPRGVRHSVAGLAAVLADFGSVLGLVPEDTVLSTAKLTFGYGFGNSLLFPLAAGARAVLLAGPIDPFVLASALRRHWPTVLCCVPRLYAGLLDLAGKEGAVDTGSVRLGVSAGEHLPAELAQRLDSMFGFPLINGLGATEVVHIVVATSPKGSPNGSTGHSVPGVTATVRDDAGMPVADGIDGRLHIVAASAALGYIDRPDADARTFADGGVYTGDIVHRTAIGDFRHVCRADDLLNLGGFKVSPLEIESQLRGLESIADCAVVPDRDAAGLEQAVAYVVPKDGADPGQVRKEIRSSLRESLAPYKRPSRVEIIDALPTTSTGKLARFELRNAQGLS